MKKYIIEKFNKKYDTDLNTDDESNICKETTEYYNLSMAIQDWVHLCQYNKQWSHIQFLSSDENNKNIDLLDCSTLN